MADFDGSEFKVFGQIGVVPRYLLKLLRHVATGYAVGEPSRPFRLLSVIGWIMHKPENTRGN